MSPLRIHKVEYRVSFWWIKQELKQGRTKVELLKLATHKYRIFMPFVDTNSHLTTKPYKAIPKATTNTVFLQPTLGVVRILYFGWKVFQQERLLSWWLAGFSHMLFVSFKLTKPKCSMYRLFINNFLPDLWICRLFHPLNKVFLTNMASAFSLIRPLSRFSQ